MLLKTVGNLITCPRNITVWQKCGLWSSINPLLLNIESFKELVCILCCSLNEDQSTLFVMTMWNLRRSRNEILWNSSDDQDIGVLNRARLVLADWKLSQAVTKVGN